MRYKNYILSKGDKVKLKPGGHEWLPMMDKKYGGKVVTIKDFILNVGFECEPLGDDLVGYFFSYDDIDEVVYCKNDHTEPSVTPKKKRDKDYGKLTRLKDILCEEREYLREHIQANHDEYTETQKAYMKSEMFILTSLIHLISFRMIDLKEEADD